MALTDITRAEILKAIDEYNRLGRSAFLHEYGFGQAVSYFLVHHGRTYESKAIVGAAHGYLPGQQPLTSHDFRGGRATVRKVLENLEFEVRAPDVGQVPTPGDVLTNAEICAGFGVGNMGGMRRSSRHKLLVLISDPFKGLYQDRWQGDVLHYTGMGPSGDQSISYAQNRTLAESAMTEIPVHLLEALEPRKYTYVGQVKLVEAPYKERQVDEDGQERDVWMFPIRPVTSGAAPKLTVAQAHAIELNQSSRAKHLSTEQLELRAQRANRIPTVRPAIASVFVRDAAIAEYARRLASGNCDLCRSPAPFRTRRNEEYLECHHVRWLSRGGEDAIENTVALCPNCHRRMHVLDDPRDVALLRRRISDRLVS